MTHILVMVDKFTKWVEVKPIRKCDGKTAVSFVKEIILRYGYPHSIITDNGTNFVKGELPRFCGDKGIRLDVCSATSMARTIEEMPSRRQINSET